jgi:uncharacterized membrane protein
MSKSIVGIAKNRVDVERVVDDLQAGGVSAADISILIPDSGGVPDTGTVKATKAPEGATTGAVAGGLTGGTLGLLAGIGSLAIPGVGPFIAAGPLMAALSGAAVGATAGGLLGALMGLGIPELEAKVFEDRIKKGGYLVAVHVNERNESKDIREILKRNHLEDISAVTEK